MYEQKEELRFSTPAADGLSCDVVVFCHHSVTLAGNPLQLLAVYNFEGTTGMSYQAVLLKNPSCKCHRRPVCAQHRRQEIVRYSNETRIDAILRTTRVCACPTKRFIAACSFKREER